MGLLSPTDHYTHIIRHTNNVGFLFIQLSKYNLWKQNIPLHNAKLTHRVTLGLVSLNVDRHDKNLAARTASRITLHIPPIPHPHQKYIMKIHA